MFVLGGYLLLVATVTCNDDVQTRLQSNLAAVSQPSKPLVWGDLKLYSLPDTHGWLGGHDKSTPPEPNYSGDLGMFSSFVSHMKAEAERRNVDLLLVDSGDMHDGNGITDGFPDGDVNGHEALELFAQLPYDVLAIGNHELYKYEVAHDVHKHFATKWNGRYLTSNVNVTVQNQTGHSVSVPLGHRFAKFKTKLGRSVTALGIIFDFSFRSAENTTVQSPMEMVEEDWFKEAISEEPDFFLLVGHMPVNKDKWPDVFNAIRTVHRQTPILIFGGHAHIRDCVQFDGRSMAMASGRYMETIGASSFSLCVKLDEKSNTGDLNFHRRYLDANPVTYSYHTGKTGGEFHTPKGREITAGVQTISDRFNLSYQFGTSPDDYFRERVPISSPQSLVSLFAFHVIPTALSVSNPRASIPNMFIANSGALRADLYRGPFTRNDQYIVSPFKNTFEYISNVSSSVADQIQDELNHSGLPSRRKRGLIDNEEEVKALALLKQGDPSATYSICMWRQWEKWSAEQSDKRNLTLGYVTEDACPGIGDDVLHAPLPLYPMPPFIGSLPPQDNGIDLIFPSFIRDSVLTIVNKLNAGSVPNVTVVDVKTYGNLLMDEVFGAFASTKWN
ncbi:hypothetical protein K439DRAFT_1352955 [Ramaria rubella]|nr:hypothetical protein K439DRAFT_1352955 [Ramaria rubella]